MGDVEEWTIRNVTGEYHVFHIYHCHILEHEDGGMMANIRLQPR